MAALYGSLLSQRVQPRTEHQGQTGGQHAQESLEAAQQKAQAVIEQLQQIKLTKAAELVERCIAETLTYYRYPDTHCCEHAPITLWSGSCARSDGALEWSVLSRMDSPP